MSYERKEILLNEDEAIHVHAKKGKYVCKAEFHVVNGIVSEIRITTSKGSKPLAGSDLKNFEVFLEHYAVK